MAYQAFRDALVNQIAATPATGRVHDRLRYVSRADDFINLFTVTIGGLTQVRGWWVEREGRLDVFVGSGRVDVQHTFVCRAIHQFRDSLESAETFEMMLDAVMDALTGMAMTGAWAVDGPRLRLSEPRTIASVLCHYAEIEVTVHEEVGL